MLTFREFIDKPTRVVGSTDANTMARTWERLAPRDPVQNLVYTNELWTLVKRLSNNKSNRAWMELVAGHELSAPDVTVYRNGIDKMVKVPGIIGQVTGEISFGNPGFHCQPVTRKQAMERDVELPGRLANLVRIAPPPLIYTNEDRSVLAGIVLHELRHAIDFHEMGDTMNAVNYTRDMGTHYEIDVDEYARNILECRAHADQVKNLINTLGGGEPARHALTETTIARMLVPELRDGMIELIDMLCAAKNENLEPPAIVRRAERNEIDRTVDLIQGICERFRIERYLRKR